MWFCRALATTWVLVGLACACASGCASGRPGHETRSPAALVPAASRSATATLPQTITLSVRGPAIVARDFTAALGELLSRIGIAILVADGDLPAGLRARGEAHTLARVRVAFAASAAPASVTVQDAWSGDVRLYRELAPARSTQIDIETAAHIVYTSIETLAKERAREQPPASAVATAPGPFQPAAPPVGAVTGSWSPSEAPAVLTPAISAGIAEPPGPPSAFGLEVAPFYALHPGAGSQSQLNGGAGLAIGLEARRWLLQPSAWFSAEYRLPFDMSAVVPARAQTTSLRITPLINVVTWSRVAVGVGVVAGLDVVNLESVIPPLSGQRLTETLAGGTLLARVRVASSAQFFLAARYEHDLSQKSFQVAPAAQGPGPGMPPVMAVSAKLPAWQASIIAGMAVTLLGQ